MLLDITNNVSKYKVSNYMDYKNTASYTAPIILRDKVNTVLKHYLGRFYEYNN